MDLLDDVLSELCRAAAAASGQRFGAVREVVELRMHEEAISGAAREIMGGDLARRVPTTGRGDEVAGGLNAMPASLTGQSGK